MSAGHEASAAAYVELTDGHKAVRWGVGIDHSISTASLKAVVSAINHQRQRDIKLEEILRPRSRPAQAAAGMAAPRPGGP
jgi:hypothetical protein